MGWIEEVPGVNCQEKTYEELKETLEVTLREALEYRSLGSGLASLFRFVGWLSVMSGRCADKKDFWVGRRGAFLPQEQFERVHRSFVVPVPEYPLRAEPCQRLSLAGPKRTPISNSLVAAW